MAEGKAAREAESYDRAVSLFKQAQKLGSTEAVAELGRCYSAGWGVPKDQAMALKLLREAEKNDEPVALHCLGFMYSLGEGSLPEDHFKAAAYWEKAAKKGLAVAHHNIGWMNKNGKGPYKVDSKRALEEYTLGAEGGYGLSLTEMGRIYMEGDLGAPKDYAKAKRYFEAALPKKQPLALYHLGLMSANGWGMPLDHLKALQYYRQGDEMGNFTCKYAIGGCYEHGTGVAQDSAQALQYYREADTNGETLASFRLGEIYFYGILGVEQDYQRAFSYFKKCSMQETPGMNYYYGIAYADGKGRPVDLKKAIAYFESGVRTGAGVCAFALAEMYLEGRGVSRDISRYKKLLLQAEKMGYDDASASLATMFHEGLHGEPASLKKAYIHYKRGAENGSADCKATVGLFLLDGLTDEKMPEAQIKQMLVEASDAGSAIASAALSKHHRSTGRFGANEALAFRYCKLASEQGDATCRKELAQRLIEGNGCDRDTTAAAALLQPLADADEPDASRELAILYARGDGVPKNTAMAYRLLLNARDGDPVAEFELGKILATGDGFMKMKSEAKKHLERAANAGHQEAAAYLEEMRSKKKRGSRLPWKR